MGYKLNFLKDPNLNDTQQTNHGGLMSKEFSAIKVCIFVQQRNLEVRKKEKKKTNPNQYSNVLQHLSVNQGVK